MQEVSRYIVFNIREYLNGQNDELGEDDLLQVLSGFFCEKNLKVTYRQVYGRCCYNNPYIFFISDSSLSISSTVGNLFLNSSQSTC